MAIRVLLVDDHELVRQGIAAMLAKADDLQIVGEPRTVREAVEYARGELPDVILMDVGMPDMDGLEATKKIKEERPRTAVVMLTMHENPAYLREAVRAGAAGYLLKDVSREELVDAIRQVATGGAFIESQMLKGMLSEMKPQGPVPAAARNLTKRERDQRRAASLARGLLAGLDEEYAGPILGQVVERLRFGALVHAHDAPAHVIVDCRPLAGIPDERDHAVTAIGGHVKDVLRVAVGRPDARLGREKARLAHE